MRMFNLLDEKVRKISISFEKKTFCKLPTKPSNVQFQCPQGFVAEYYFDYFSTYSSYHVVWLTGEGFKKDISGSLFSSYLYKWTLSIQNR